jgi:mercuric ion transport protein
MDKGRSPLGSHCFRAGIWGSIAAAICCATPVLTFLLGVFGLAFLTPYIDYVLLPLIGAFLLLAIYGWIQQRRVSRRP